MPLDEDPNRPDEGSIGAESLEAQLSAAFDAASGDAALDAGQPVDGSPLRSVDIEVATSPASHPNSNPDARRAADKPSERTAIVPPASWSATAKASFAALPPHIQQEVVKREQDVERGLAQWQTKGERLNRLDQVLAPRQQRFQLAGIDEVQAVQALFAAQDLLERDPVSALMYLARQSGVDFRQLVEHGARQQAHEPQLHPVLQGLVGEVQSLRSAVAQQHEDSRRAQASEYSSQVQAFAADPANLYFQNVARDMATLIRSRQADTLQDAYEKACWASPEIRPLMLEQQQRATRDAARGAASARADAARRAGGSVIGSPSPGAAPGRSGPPLSLEDELRAAFAAAS